MLGGLLAPKMGMSEPPPQLFRHSIVCYSVCCALHVLMCCYVYVNYTYYYIITIIIINYTLRHCLICRGPIYKISYDLS